MGFSARRRIFAQIIFKNFIVLGTKYVVLSPQLKTFRQVQMPFQLGWGKQTKRTDQSESAACLLSTFPGFFCIFNFLQFAIDGENNSKAKVEKVFFFIFMSSYAVMSFLN
jgi:hypothetical protein